MSAPAGRERHRWLTAAVVAAVVAGGIAAVAFPLGTHFADTRNWKGLGIIAGCLLALMTASSAVPSGGDRRGPLAALRRACGFLGYITAVAGFLGPAAWFEAGPGRGWHGPGLYGLGAAWALAWLAAGLAAGKARRRLYWRKYGYTPEQRRADADAYRIIPRRRAQRRAAALNRRER